MKQRNEKRIPILVFIAMAVVALLAVFSFTSFQRLIETARLLSQATRIINNAEQVIKSVVDIETGQRGYVITGDTTFLQPFLESSKNIYARLSMLDSLTRSDSSQRQRVTALNELAENCLTWAYRTVEARKESFEQAQKLVLTGEGKTISDNARKLVNEIQREERERFLRQNTITANSLRQFQYYFIGLAIAITIAITYLFYTVNAALKARNKIEHQVMENAKEIQDLYDNAPCGYLSVDQNIFLSNINQTLLHWLGYTRGEVIGKMKYEDLLSPKSRAAFLASFETDFSAYKERGHVTDLEFEFQRKDGSTFPVIVSSAAVVDDQGVFTGSRTTVFDNTARKQTEELLREREERFRSIVSSVHDAIIILNEQGLVVNCNKGAERIFGRTESDMLGKPISTIMPEKYRDLHKQGLKRFRETGKSNIIGKTLNLEGLRNDNTVFPIELSIGTWQTGEHIFYCGIIRDITERKETEKLMSEMAAIVESSEDAIISLSPDGTVFSWNRGAQELYGYTQEDVIGKNIAPLIIPEEFVEDSERIVGIVQKGKSITQHETVRMQKDGTRVDISLTLSPIYDKAGNLVGISKIAHNITDRKKKEQQVLQLNKELDAFTYSVSHDLRTPLRSISGYAQILQEDYSPKLDEEGNRVINIVIRSAKRMSNLIDDLLNFARMSRKELNMGKIDMRQLVEQVLGELPESTNGKTEMKLNPLLPAPGDNSMITQVWVNLISNALKYSGKNEHIEIEIGSYAEGKEICYYVRDNGVGFDMQYYDKLFGVFQRLHKINEFEGTGVGLALVKRIVDRHKGRVWAEGKVNEGATFYFSLPKKRAPHNDKN